MRLSLLYMLAAFAALSHGLASIRSGEVWYDTAGRPINAHGGGMLLHESVYYWYGSVRSADAPGEQMNGGISLYSSRDLYRWDYHGIVLPVYNFSGSDTGTGLDLERLVWAGREVTEFLGIETRSKAGGALWKRMVKEGRVSDEGRPDFVADAASSAGVSKSSVL